MLDLKTSIPELTFISEDSVHDIKIMDLIPVQKDGYYIMYKAYVNFERLFSIRRERTNFVVRNGHAAL
ncbi:MAG: hypothetical protein ABI813_05345 [Bacteroidota bacterium]